MPRRKTHEEFIQEMNSTNPNIIIIGQYVNAKTPIECKCKKCDYEWFTNPDTLHRGSGCPKCGGTLKRTHNDFLNLVDSKITILSKYRNAHSKVKCQCKKCDYVWDAIADDLIRGSGCPKCAGNIKKTHEEYLSQLKLTNPNIELLNQYVSCHSKIKYRCNICGYEGMADAVSLLSGHGCYRCGIEISKKKQRKSHDLFVDEMSKLNNNIEILGKYINNNSRIHCKCKICEHEWNPLANNLLSGYGCPNCNMSSLEQFVYSYLYNNSINFEQRYTFSNLKGIGNKLLSYDFYLPNCNLLIECQGIQHYQPIKHFGGKEKFKIQQEHDKRKREYAKENNIKLLEIPYWDYENIEQILLRELSLVA